MLNNGGPVVIEGPNPGWCVQAIADNDEQTVQIEVLDPQHWESGPAPITPKNPRGTAARASAGSTKRSAPTTPAKSTFRI